MNNPAVQVMEHAGFKAQLMKAQRLIGDDVHGLPPGLPIDVYPIAAVPGAPSKWKREAGTYVCPVDVGWGLWFNWTDNPEINTAVLPSVKGMNPITGQKIHSFGLERYADKCPVHGTAFSHGRLCENCGYEWPPQNYVTTPDTLWWDGFRQPDGSVRQFFFTDEDKRDIASLVIGKENTVPAFGFAFYTPKIPREEPRGSILRGMSSVCGQSIGISSHYYSSSSNISCSLSGEKGYVGPSGAKGSVGSSGAKGNVVDSFSCSIEGKVPLTKSMPSPVKESISTSKKRSKLVAVGAGAKIDQSLTSDGYDLDTWKEEPSGVIRLYFCFLEQFEKMCKDGGLRQLKSSPEGYLKDLPVG